MNNKPFTDIHIYLYNRTIKANNEIERTERELLLNFFHISYNNFQDLINKKDFEKAKHYAKILRKFHKIINN